MEVVRVCGVVASDKDYKESSEILNIITKEYGLINVLAKGSKRLKSDLRSVSENFTYAYFDIVYKENKLSTLVSASIINPLKNIKKDIVKISYINFLCDLTSQVLKQTSKNDVFDNLIAAILKIEDGFDPMLITNILELKYLSYLGIEPNLNGCVVCGRQNIITLSSYKGGFVCKEHANDDYIVSKKTIKIIRMLKYVDISKISKLDVSNLVKSEINTFIDEYYDRYTGLYLKSKNFLKSMETLQNS